MKGLLNMIKNIEVSDVIAIIMIVTWIFAKLNHIDTAIDAALGLIIAFYFGSKHKTSNKKS